MQAQSLSIDAERYWVKQHLPSIRIGKTFNELGERTCLARFELGGEEHIVEESGDDADDKLIRRVAQMLRDALRIPSPDSRTSRDALERQVIAAAARGDTASADALGRQLVMQNARAPRMLLASTGFGRQGV